MGLIRTHKLVLSIVGTRRGREAPPDILTFDAGCRVDEPRNPQGAKRRWGWQTLKFTHYVSPGDCITRFNVHVGQY